MDYVQGFKDLFEDREFTQFKEFKCCLEKYMKDFNVIYVLGSSTKSNNGRLKYTNMSYRCINYKRRKSVSRGVRHVHSHATCCQSRFNVAKRKSILVVSSFSLEHNHELSASLFLAHPINRRLTADELNGYRYLLEYNSPTAELKQYVADAYGKYMTTTDVCNMRRRLRPSAKSKRDKEYFRRS
ncbi:hypothetical protein PHET_11713 [Paragonimus heterotremus]|uniref:FAR1 domain-containing protein n=1 Tax=Paragonimus heterotremus TaxID=100268 RepID=A0A8J4T8T0_9TREM|nr:hypothetical protein PHET_11713 [Paragonimus heterotremus]